MDSPGTDAERQQRRIDRWQNDQLCSIFFVTLNPEVDQPSVCFLSSIAAEQQEAGTFPLRLTEEHVDRIVIERLAHGFGGTTPFLYFVGAANRCDDSLRSVSDPKQKEFLNNVFRIVLSYSVLVLFNPDLCEVSGDLPAPAEQLWAALRDKKISPYFMSMFIQRMQEEDVRDEAPPLNILFDPIFEKVSQESVRNSSLMDDFVSALQYWQLLTSIPEVCPVVAQSPRFLPSNVYTGRTMEDNTLFGPLLKPTTWPTDQRLVLQYFKGAAMKTRQHVEGAQMTLRGQLVNVANSITAIMKALLVPKATREQMLKWLRSVVEFNKTLTRMQPGAMTSSEGFMFNFVHVMLNLAEPILIPEKLEKTVDVSFVVSPTFDMKGVTRFNATEQELSEAFGRKAGHSYNFPTECIFITMRALHMSFIRTTEAYRQLMQKIHELQDEVKRLEDSKLDWMNAPDSAQKEAQLKERKEQFEKFIESKLAVDTQLMDRVLYEKVYKYYVATAQWALQLTNFIATSKPDAVQGEDASDDAVVPLEIRAIPEHFVEDIVDFLRFLFDFMPAEAERLFRFEGFNVVVEFLMRFMGHSSLLKNVHLRGKIGQVFGTIFGEDHQGRLRRSRNNDDDDMMGAMPTELLTALENFDVARGSLVKLLLHVFRDVEHTGEHNQFYDKFLPRYHMARLLRRMSGSEAFTSALQTESHDRYEFIKFLNLLCNDATFQLDEGLKKLSDIRTYERLMETPGGLDEAYPDREARQDAGQLYNTNLRSTKSWWAFANETVRLLRIISQSCSESLIDGVMLDRVAAMLNYELTALAGPRCSELKIKNPERFAFNPRLVLGNIAQIYLNLSKHDSFLEAVIRDGRSFNIGVFQRASSFLSRGIIPKEQVHTFEQMVQRIEDITGKVQAEDALMDDEDIPDEYLDPITCAIMTDPVRLPTSGQVMDRDSIERHLLSDPTDPFNRQALSIVDVVPLDELKAEIQSFISSKRRRAE